MAQMIMQMQNNHEAVEAARRRRKRISVVSWPVRPENKPTKRERSDEPNVRRLDSLHRRNERNGRHREKQRRQNGQNVHAPRPAMLWIRERNPATGHDAAELACTYFADRLMVEEVPWIQAGKLSIEPKPPLLPVQEEQRAKEEKTTEKKSNDRVTWDKDRGPRCFACQKFGHIATHCPDAKTVPKTKVREGKLGRMAGYRCLKDPSMARKRRDY